MRKDKANQAQVAELVDALASGASDLMVVEVQVLFWAPLSLSAHQVSSDETSLAIACRQRFTGGLRKDAYVTKTDEL